MAKHDIPSHSRTSRNMAHNAKVKAKANASRFAGMATDEFKDRATDLVEGSIMPSIQGMLYDIGMDLLHLIIYRGKETKRGKRRPSEGVSYHRYYKDRYRDSGDRFARGSDSYRSRRDSDRRTCTGYDPDDIPPFRTRSEAESVLDAMKDAIEEHDLVRVFDLYQLAGCDTLSTDTKYGWVSLKKAEVYHDRTGWHLHLPKPAPIE